MEIQYYVRRLKRFTSGRLDGIIIEERIKARSLDDAKRLSEKYTVNEAIGGGSYEIIYGVIEID